MGHIMNDHITNSVEPLASCVEAALAVVDFVEDGIPVKGARVTIRPSSLPSSVGCVALGVADVGRCPYWVRNLGHRHV